MDGRNAIVVDADYNKIADVTFVDGAYNLTNVASDADDKVDTINLDADANAITTDAINATVKATTDADKTYTVNGVSYLAKAGDIEFDAKDNSSTFYGGTVILNADNTTIIVGDKTIAIIPTEKGDKVLEVNATNGAATSVAGINNGESFKVNDDEFVKAEVGLMNTTANEYLPTLTADPAVYSFEEDGWKAYGI